jgi:outer membrane protein assembly factor BamB
MRIAAKLGTIAIITALGGCSTLADLNPFGTSEKRNPPAPLVDFKQSMTARTLWTASVGRAGNFVFSPALSNGSLYAASGDGLVSRVDALTGRQIWQVSTGMPLTAGVGTDGSTVAVAGEKGVILAYDTEGKLRWKAQASSEILSAPAVGQGVVVVRSVDNRIAAYDADSGVRRWFLQRTTPVLTLRTAPGIQIIGPTAFVALPGGRLLALAAETGAPRWEAAVGDPRGATELERVADVAGMPLVLGRDVCAVSYQGRVACFDAITGASRWAKNFSSDVGLAADERFIYAVDEKGAVVALSRESGAGAWKSEKLANRRLSAPAATGNAVAVGDYEGYVHFLSREDGAFVARIATDGSSLTGAAPLTDGKTAFFQTQAGNLVALTAE